MAIMEIIDMAFMADRRMPIEGTTRALVVEAAHTPKPVAVKAQRLDSANRALLELKRQVQADEPRSVIGRTVEKIEGLLGTTGANLMYAGCQREAFSSFCCSAIVLEVAADSPTRA
jgi:hypothetical protein